MIREEAIKSFEEENGIKKYIASLNKNHPAYQGYLEIIERNEMAISALKGGWIPINEREPDLMEEVLLSLRSLEVVTGWRSETVFHGKRCYYICDGGDYAISDNVLAWMPKPEPYKAESEE